MEDIYFVILLIDVTFSLKKCQKLVTLSNVLMKHEKTDIIGTGGYMVEPTFG